MCTRKKTKEVPVQNFAKIKYLFLPSVLSGGQLFTDLSFPPDQSSLTYVYSGDDKYEKMVFKRPLVRVLVCGGCIILFISFSIFLHFFFYVIHL